jgi:chitinase
MISIKPWIAGLHKLLPLAIGLLLAANCQLPTANAQAQPCREVIGYYPSWKFYDRQQLVNPSTIDYSKYTILNYAFFEPKPDGSVVPFDPRTDKLLLLGGDAALPRSGFASSNGFEDTGVPKTSASLVEKAHEHSVKVVISIGGWTLSQNFSPIAASPERRRNFAHSCADLVRNYNVDGVDIDWEYPGYRAQGGSLNDGHYFTLLLREVRDSLTALQWQIDRRLYLTAAFGCAPTRIDVIEWQEVVPLLDFVNMMTYDFYGRDFSVTNHNAPLYPPAKGITGYDTHSTIHYLIEKYNVPPMKICLGVPFYGRAMKTKSKPGLHVGSAQTVDNRTFAEDDGSPSFYNILAKQNLFFYDWDSLAQAPFLRSKNSNTFVTFDDERSVARKARYILDYELAGAILWDITGDYIESPTQRGTIERTPLADALKNTLCHIDPIYLETGKPSTMDILPTLPQTLSLVKTRQSSPRVLTASKKLTKKERRKLNRALKKKRKNGPSPKLYFDGTP